MTSDGPERVILEGIPVPQFAELEVRGADEASFRVLDRPPDWLGGRGPSAASRNTLRRFRRTSRVVSGHAVFMPAD